ncbi:MAG: FtsQ-type POTRA domain-containing protein [Armatimonadetes bacterium]|nr:FtsQ-type POTRA domain-containing protein [Armatimonadota bacterium]
MRRRHTSGRGVGRTAARACSPRRVRRNRRRRRIPRVLWLLAILIVEAAAVGLKDPRFNLARVEVRGTRVLTREQVVRRAGLAPGVNLFRAPVKRARARLRGLPAVAEVSLHRLPPDRILIRVRERRPMACVAAQNGLFTVDGEGVAFRPELSPPRAIPLVSGLEGRKLRPGDRIPAEAARVLRECLAAAATAIPGQQLARVSIDQNGNLCFNRGAVAHEVRIGPPEQLSEKLALLAALEQSLPDIRSDCEYIDLSCPEAPAWKPRPPGVAPRGPRHATAPAGAGEDAPHVGRGIAQD